MNIWCHKFCTPTENLLWWPLMREWSGHCHLCNLRTNLIMILTRNQNTTALLKCVLSRFEEMISCGSWNFTLATVQVGQNQFTKPKTRHKPSPRLHIFCRVGKSLSKSSILELYCMEFCILQLTFTDSRMYTHRHSLSSISNNRGVLYIFFLFQFCDDSLCA